MRQMVFGQYNLRVCCLCLDASGCSWVVLVWELTCVELADFFGCIFGNGPLRTRTIECVLVSPIFHKAFGPTRFLFFFLLSRNLRLDGLNILISGWRHYRLLELPLFNGIINKSQLLRTLRIRHDRALTDLIHLYLILL